MRILVTTFPALGHLHPMMPLILAAQRAGHDVVVATGPDLTGWVGACGLEARAVGVSDDEARSIAAASFPGPFQNSHMFTDVWVSAAMPALVELSSSWMPDLVVHEEADYAGVLMAAALDVPCVTHSWASPARIATDRAHTEKALAPIWERFLPDTAPRRVGQLYLDSCPPPLQTSDLAAIARQTRVVSIRPGTFDGPPATPPAFLLDLPRPAAYLTLGTVPVFSTPALLAKIAHALARRSPRSS